MDDEIFLWLFFCMLGACFWIVVAPGEPLWSNILTGCAMVLVPLVIVWLPHPYP